MTTHALSVDIGGTFTDFSLLDLSTGEVSVHKLLTDPENPAQALMQGASELLKRVGIDFERLRVVVHSTTLTTNAIMERKGARTGLITTKGFRDILQLGREQIYDIYDLHAQLPVPLVPRYLRQEVAERLNRNGEVLRHPDEGEALSAVGELVKQGVEALAISLLHAYKNPANERTLKTIIASRFPDLTLSLSSEVAPVINEYERTSTTVADCYIKPSVSRYLGGVEGKLRQEGYRGSFLVMHSEGGVLGSETAREHPVRLLESGPAAGALAASFYGSLLGQPHLISLDMGGTTAKICVIEDGRPSVTNAIEVARVHRFKKGSGLPIVIPVLDLSEIGSGGGSIAWVDNLGLLRVGPQSAGAKPGPACYAMGGDRPTVTDANLVLGYLNPDYFLGGRIALDVVAARRAISGLAEALGMSEIEAAWGVYNVVTENMAASARIYIIERNKDPRNYALIAFGGAGPAHACQVARILGVRRVIAPLAAGVTSALGCLTAPISFDEVRSLPGLLEDSDWDTVNQIYREMERRSLGMLQEVGVSPNRAELVRSADMQLVGQIHQINVPVPHGGLGSASLERMEADFHEIYQGLYGRKNLSIPIEVQNWRLLARGPKPSVHLRKEAITGEADPRTAGKETRRAYFPAGGGYVDCPVYDRYRLVPGSQLEGPAVVEEQESTAVIGPQDRASVDEWLNLIIDVG
ncbi:MAG: hydantoinase/oxoprolinase family protein [Candidatus Methylomirabilales bacterium]